MDVIQEAILDTLMDLVEYGLLTLDADDVHIAQDMVGARALQRAAIANPKMVADELPDVIFVALPHQKATLAIEQLGEKNERLPNHIFKGTRPAVATGAYEHNCDCNPRNN